LRQGNEVLAPRFAVITTETSLVEFRCPIEVARFRELIIMVTERMPRSISCSVIFGDLRIDRLRRS